MGILRVFAAASPRAMGLSFAVGWILAGTGVVQAQSAGDIEAQISASLGEPLGILGALPLSAEKVNVAAKGRDFAVLLNGLSYGSVDLGALEFSMSPVGDGVFSVDGVAFSGGEAYGFDQWTWRGQWDFSAQSYRDLDYSIAGLSIDGADATYGVERFDLTVASSVSGGEHQSQWQLAFDQLSAAQKADEGWNLSIARFESDTTSFGDEPINEYGAVARLISSLGLVQTAGQEAVKASGSMLRQLPQIFQTGESVMMTQTTPITRAQAKISASGVRLVVPALALKVQVDAVALESDTVPAPDGTLSVTTTITGDKLDVVRREDTANIFTGQLDISLSEYDLPAFLAATQSLFGQPEPGDTWSFLSDLVAFYQNFGVTASVVGANLALPDRQFAVSLDAGSGTVSLSDMKQDGAALGMEGSWIGLDIKNTGDVPQGVTPEPTVLYGRVLRFDPLTTALIPRSGQGKLSIGNLPMGQVRQMLSTQPHAAPLYDTSALMREALPLGLGLMTPFLITAPQASIKEAIIEGNGYRIEVDSAMTINPIVRPLFSFGTTTLAVEGLESLTGIAEEILAQEAAKGEDADADLIDWASRVKDTWIARALKYAADGDTEPYDYRIEATQTGQVQVNGTTIFDVMASN